MCHYYTVRIPWSPRPTQWHPTDRVGPFKVLQRGAFETRREAEAWARDKLGGRPFSIKIIDPDFF